MDFYTVEFRGNRRRCFANANNLEVEVGQCVVVQADRGEDYGKVIRRSQPAEYVNSNNEFPKILRIGTDNDRDRMVFNRQKEKETFEECLDFIAKHKLNMKLVDVEYQFDCNKITFFFTAEKRVDFRTLVKDLAATYKTRIELRQIGVRDEAKRFDNCGICGQKQCCSNWLKDFSTVTTQMARVQNLALNPQKISGNCGRLLCCLRYEMDFYDEALPLYPKIGSRCKTKRGTGVVTKVDIFNEKLNILLDDNGEIVMTLTELKKAKNQGAFQILEEPGAVAAEEEKELETFQE